MTIDDSGIATRDCKGSMRKELSEPSEHAVKAAAAIKFYKKYGPESAITTTRAEGYAAGYAAAREEAKKVAENRAFNSYTAFKCSDQMRYFTDYQEAKGIAESISALAATEETK